MKKRSKKLFRLRRLPEHLRSRLNKRARPPLEQHWKWVDKKFMLIKKYGGGFAICKTAHLMLAC